MTVAGLPFTEKPGMLYVAPLGGAEPPDLTVHRGAFHYIWPSSWLAVPLDGGLTDPKQCSATQTTTLIVRVAEFLVPRPDPVATEYSWSFGPAVDKWLSRLVGSPEVRMMIGWESADARDRVVARQAVIREDGSLLLERARKAPKPALRWWQWLLRWRKPARVAEQHPPFTVYLAGQRVSS